MHNKTKNGRLGWGQTNSWRCCGRHGGQHQAADWTGQGGGYRCCCGTCQRRPCYLSATAVVFAPIPLVVCSQKQPVSQFIQHSKSHLRSSMDDQTYPIHSSAGGRPSGFSHNGDSRRKRSSSEVYLMYIARRLGYAHLSRSIAGRQSARKRVKSPGGGTISRIGSK
jgi:hypothetical protein